MFNFPIDLTKATLVFTQVEIWLVKHFFLENEWSNVSIKRWIDKSCWIVSQDFLAILGNSFGSDPLK